MFKVILLSLAVTYAFAGLGIDFDALQTSANPDTFACFFNSNVTSIAMQFWDGNGGINADFHMNYYSARRAGVRHVDAIATVCNTVFTPEDICNGIMDKIPGAFDGMVWLDVQPSRGCWTDSMGDRIPFVENVVRTCENFGLEVGLYSTSQSWTVLMGNQYATSGVLTNYPIWYAGSDGQAGFTDFSQVRFGGWSNPTMKKYSTSQPLCGLTVNLDYY